jgi:hypothetical protein
MCSMDAAGSPYAAFRRAIEARNLTRALTEARDLPQISLVDAFAGVSTEPLAAALAQSYLYAEQGVHLLLAHMRLLPSVPKPVLATGEGNDPTRRKRQQTSLPRYARTMMGLAGSPRPGCRSPVSGSSSPPSGSAGASLRASAREPTASRSTTSTRPSQRCGGTWRGRIPESSWATGTRCRPTCQSHCRPRRLGIQHDQRSPVADDVDLCERTVARTAGAFAAAPSEFRSCFRWSIS